MRRWAGGRAVTSRPSISSRPLLGDSSPAISRSVVDLPQPDGPSSTVKLPDWDVQRGLGQRGGGVPVLADALQ
jgi:hypothetical protein